MDILGFGARIRTGHDGPARAGLVRLNLAFAAVRDHLVGELFTMGQKTELGGLSRRPICSCWR